MPMLPRTLLSALFIIAALPAAGADSSANWSNYREAEFVAKTYTFKSGESLPEVKLHYRTLGTPTRGADGKIVNAVLLLQSNTRPGANWLRPSLADEFFKPGQT